MPRRRWVSLAMLAVGVGLFGAAQLAGAASERRGGIFRSGTIGASFEIDPQVAYITTSWWMQYATAAKLYNYRPGGKLMPEVASRFTVSNDGRRYTFFIRKGFRFSDGMRVTPSSFKYAFDRIASPQLASPARQFIRNVRRVDARGKRLIITLASADRNLVPLVTLPFFQATSTKLPLDRQVIDVDSVDDLPTAGPYAFTLNEVNERTSLRRNPYWTRGPGRTAPRNLAGVDFLWNLNEQRAFEMVERGELDESPIPAAEIENVARRYGVNRTRFWVKGGPCVGYIAFNNRSGLLRDNVEMRKAINWALDRTDYTGRAPAYARVPWTHILPPGWPGSITTPRLQPYAPRPELERARSLAAGHFGDGRITVYFRSSGTVNPAQAQIVRRDLVNLGFDPANITMKGFSGGQIYVAMARPNADFDLAVSLSWCHDRVNPVSTFLPLGPFPDSPEYLARIARASKLRGKDRSRAFGRLDLDIMRNLAPFAVMNTTNDRFFFSDRVDPGSLSFHAVYSGWNIPSLALK